MIRTSSSVSAEVGVTPIVEQKSFIRSGQDSESLHGRAIHDSGRASLNTSIRFLSHMKWPGVLSSLISWRPLEITDILLFLDLF